MTSVPAASPPPRAVLARGVLSQAGMELRLVARAGESLIVTLGIPLGLLVFFSIVDVLPTGDRPAVDFLVPGVLALSVAATGMVAMGIQTAFERKYGVLKRLGGTPLPRWGFLLAKGLAVAAVMAVQAVLVTGIAAAALGWRPAGGGVLLPLGMLAGAITFTAIGLLLAGTLRAEATLALSNLAFLVLLLVSGVAFDADTLPARLAEVGALLPLGALVTLLRTALDDGALAVGALTTVALWGLAAVLAAARWFRWDP